MDTPKHLAQKENVLNLVGKTKMVLEFLELGNLQFGEDGEDYIACCPDDEHLRAAWENFG